MYEHVYIFVNNFFDVWLLVIFIQCNNAQMWILSSLMARSTNKDSIEIYFIFLWALFHFICILEVYTNFWNCKRKWKNEINWWAVLGLIWPKVWQHRPGPKAGTAQSDHDSSMAWEWACSHRATGTGGGATAGSSSTVELWRRLHL
jgi:hypothetical protein